MSNTIIYLLMDICNQCINQANWKCTVCTLLFCQEHNYFHKMQFKEHKTNKFSLFYDPDQIMLTIQEISSKIHIINKCKLQLLSSTEELITKVSQLCKNKLNELNDYQNKCVELLISLRNKAQVNEVDNFNKYFSKILFYEDPISFPLEELESRYENEFFKEMHEMNNMSTEQIEVFLEREHGLLIRGHINTVLSLAISMDNRHIVSSSEDNTVRVWDTKDRIPEIVFKGHCKAVTSVAISSDNKFVVSGSDDMTVRIWSLTNRRTKEDVLEGHNDKVKCVAITSDNKRALSGSADKSTIIWSMRYKWKESIVEGHRPQSLLWRYLVM